MINARSNLDFKNELKKLDVGEELQYGKKEFMRVIGGFIVDDNIYKTSIFIPFIGEEE